MAMEPAQGGGDMDAFIGMVSDVDEAISQIGQFLGQASPDAGEAMSQVQGQFRQIIKGALSGGGGRQGQGAQPPVDANVGAADARQAY